MKNKKIILLIAFWGIFILNSIVLAELLTDWPPSPAGTPLTVTSTVTDLVRYLYEWGIALGGLVAFVVLLIAGFNYLTSVGDPGKMKEAIERIKYALGGLVLLLGSWLILHTINPELTTLKPLEFVLEIGVNSCETNADCKAIKGTADYVCIGDAKRADGIKGGNCMLRTKIAEARFCDFAVLYEDINYNKDSTDKKRRVVRAGERYAEFETASIRVFRKAEIIGKGTHNDQGIETANGDYVEGGLCSIALFRNKGAWFGFTGCRNQEGFTMQSNPDISTDTRGEEVRCVRVMKPGVAGLGEIGGMQGDACDAHNPCASGFFCYEGTCWISGGGI